MSNQHSLTERAEWERKRNGTGGRRSGRRPAGPGCALRDGGAAGAGAVQRHRGHAPGPERYPPPSPPSPGSPSPSPAWAPSSRCAPGPRGAAEGAIFSTGRAKMAPLLCPSPQPVPLAPPFCTSTVGKEGREEALSEATASPIIPLPRSPLRQGRWGGPLAVRWLWG